MKSKYVRLFDLKGKWGKHRPFTRTIGKLTPSEKRVVQRHVQQSNAAQTRRKVRAIVLALALTAMLGIWLINYSSERFL